VPWTAAMVVTTKPPKRSKSARTDLANLPRIVAPKSPQQIAKERRIAALRAATPTEWNSRLQQGGLSGVR
jgi:hypothetical protein